MYIAWARVLGAEYAQLIEDLKHQRATFIGAYGATNPAEFFALVTEAFFEQPLQLKRAHPQLYEQLMTFYQQDPAARLTRARLETS
jgi:Mlc titration factor MtfA (ptsG expression regulator)